MHPRYLDPNCPDCGEPLVLSDTIDNPDIDIKDVWLDEWACPKCYDGDSIWIDFAPEEKAELDRRIKEANEHPERSIPWEEVRDKLHKRLGLTDEEIKKREEEALEAVAKIEEDEADEEDNQFKSRGILNFD